MKHSKLRDVIAFYVIALLVLGSVGSFGSSTKENKTFLITNIKVKNSAVSINVQEQFNNEKLQTYGEISYGPYKNVVVTNTSVNESYPSMVMEGYTGLIAYEYEAESETRIYLRSSIDYGQHWLGAKQVIALINKTPIEINSPSLSIIPFSNNAYGMFMSPVNNSSVFGYMKIIDIANIDKIYTYPFEWTGFKDQSNPDITYDFWDFDSPKILSYKNTTTPWVIVLTGSTNYTSEDGSGPCTDSLMFSFNDLQFPDEWVTLVWYPEIQYCSHLSISRLYDDSIIYGICEIKNGSNQDLLFFKGYPKRWYNESLPLINQTLTSSSSLTHPHINVTKNQICIVADSDTDGIVLYSSSDNGNSWELKKVTADILPTSANPNYPMIYANDEGLLCTFVESNNIYLTSSINNGFNWSEPLQLNSVNNSVVEEYRFADLTDENHILWTDNRSGNNDIYSVLLDVPQVDLTVVPESITLESENIPFFKSKNWITFTIENNGNISVEKVSVEVVYTCANESPQSTGYEAIISYLPPGSSESFRRPLFRVTLGEFINALLNYPGIESITVTVDPDKKYTDIYPQDNSQTIPVTYKEIFPRFAFLENLLTR